MPLGISSVSVRALMDAQLPTTFALCRSPLAAPRHLVRGEEQLSARRSNRRLVHVEGRCCRCVAALQRAQVDRAKRDGHWPQVRLRQLPWYRAVVGSRLGRVPHLPLRPRRRDEGEAVSDEPRRRTPNVRRAKPDRRYHDRREPEERRQPPTDDKPAAVTKTELVVLRRVAAGEWPWPKRRADERPSPVRQRIVSNALTRLCRKGLIVHDMDDDDVQQRASFYRATVKGHERVLLEAIEATENES